MKIQENSINSIKFVEIQRKSLNLSVKIIQNLKMNSSKFMFIKADLNGVEKKSKEFKLVLTEFNDFEVIKSAFQ